MIDAKGHGRETRGREKHREKKLGCDTIRYFFFSTADASSLPRKFHACATNANRRPGGYQFVSLDLVTPILPDAEETSFLER